MQFVQSNRAFAATNHANDSAADDTRSGRTKVVLSRIVLFK
jgi:hypothetical protein